MLFGVLPTNTNPRASLQAEANEYEGRPSSGNHVQSRRGKNFRTTFPPVDGTRVSHLSPPLQWDAGRSCTYTTSVALYVIQNPADRPRPACTSNWLPSHSTTTCHSSFRNATLAV